MPRDAAHDVELGRGGDDDAAVALGQMPRQAAEGGGTEETREAVAGEAEGGGADLGERSTGERRKQGREPADEGAIAGDRGQEGQDRAALGEPAVEVEGDDRRVSNGAAADAETAGPSGSPETFRT
jgi:hypothetical protein